VSGLPDQIRFQRLALPHTIQASANDLADYAEVDILEEEDTSEFGAQRFNLEWMQKVVYTIKPALEQ